MQIIPAIDLKDNKCVRLTKGKDETSFVFNENPEKQATYFQEIGCKKLHVVDLDAAFGRPEINSSSIKKIRKSIKSNRTFRTLSNRRKKVTTTPVGFRANNKNSDLEDLEF